MLDIRNVAQNENLTDLAQAIGAATWSPASEIAPDDYTEGSLTRYLGTSDAILVVASDEGVLAGMASARVLCRPSGERWLYIDEMDVCLPWQRQGVATAMMEHLIVHAMKEDCAEVWVATEVDNAAAKALYESLTPTEVTPCVGYTYKIERRSVGS